MHHSVDFVLSHRVEPSDSGKALAATHPVLFIRGVHSIAYITPFAVWAVPAAWLLKVGRP